MRLLFGLRFRDLDLLISDQVTRDSQLLFHRSLSDRLSLVAPFLHFDKDPYVVIDGSGRLVYIQDAFTTSDRFPNAQAFDPSALGQSGLAGDPFNYIRNSVKITVDAYDGTMHFYVSDPNDPIIRDYAAIFPNLFEPLSAMPADLREHLRVPEELFNVQTRMFGRYHVTDTQQFFRTDDLWTVPEQTSEETLPSEAYYVVMRLPGEKGVEFLLLQPMVPTSRPNMIAWIAARMDGANYGSTLVYRFPADTTIFGPSQIEARIDQDPTISAQMTLWDQSGSKVVRGSLIVVPIDNSLIYLQPFYLQSTGSAFPEFKRIVVASPRQVVWSDTLGGALNLLLAAEGGAAPSPSPTPTPEPGAVRLARTGRQPDAHARRRPAVRRARTDRLRQHPFRARPGRAERRRLRALRLGDRARPGRAPAPPGPGTGARVPGPRGIGQPGAVSRGAALSGALLVTLASPATWPLALAGFLLRGGLIVVALPILVLPTPVGLGNVLAPTLTAFVFGGVSVELVAVVVADRGRRPRLAGRRRRRWRRSSRPRRLGSWRRTRRSRRPGGSGPTSRRSMRFRHADGPGRAPAADRGHPRLPGARTGPCAAGGCARLGHRAARRGHLSRADEPGATWPRRSSGGCCSRRPRWSRRSLSPGCWGRRSAPWRPGGSCWPAAGSGARLLDASQAAHSPSAGGAGRLLAADRWPSAPPSHRRRSRRRRPAMSSARR